MNITIANNLRLFKYSLRKMLYLLWLSFHENQKHGYQAYPACYDDCNVQSKLRNKNDRGQKCSWCGTHQIGCIYICCNNPGFLRLYNRRYGKIWSHKECDNKKKSETDEVYQPGDCCILFHKEQQRNGEEHHQSKYWLKNQDGFGCDILNNSFTQQCSHCQSGHKYGKEDAHCQIDVTINNLKCNKNSYFHRRCGESGRKHTQVCRICFHNKWYPQDK